MVIEFIQSQIWGIISGIVIGVLGTIVSDKVKSWNEAIKIKREKRKVRPINLFEEYAYKNELKQAVSYGDSDAIILEPLMHSGKFILSAKVNITQCPKSKENREFVMALLQYIPSTDWSYFSDLGYYLSFRIRGTIIGVQLEIKDPEGHKVIDKYVKVTDSFKKHCIGLGEKKGQLGNVSEVCFTIFCEDKYIGQEKGRFEVIDCMITKG